MMRKIAIGLVAAAIAMGGSTLSVSAFRGGGGFGHGFGGPHFAGGFGRGGFAARGHFGPRAFGFHGREFGFRRFHRFDFDRFHRFHRFGFRDRFEHRRFYGRRFY